jgi:hypothetical protein
MSKSDPPPPPDPGKVTGQVVVDVVCLILTVATAVIVAAAVAQLRQPGDITSEILFLLLALVAAIFVAVLGVVIRAGVRRLFGVADTERREEPDDSRQLIPADVDEDDVSEPTVCLMCRSQIPAGATQCPSCGWTYLPR